jgi:hypothetical protein
MDSVLLPLPLSLGDTLSTTILGVASTLIVSNRQKGGGNIGLVVAIPPLKRPEIKVGEVGGDRVPFQTTGAGVGVNTEEEAAADVVGVKAEFDSGFGEGSTAISAPWCCRCCYPRASFPRGYLPGTPRTQRVQD